jgi:ADP-ribose pyrophosphatase YjhB (NUDIX family)
MPVALVLAHTDDGRIVLTRRHDWPADAWALVAGFIELDESAEDAALRELREETGLDGRNPRVRRTLVRDDLLLVCVEVEVDEASPVAAADADEAVLVGDAADRIPRDWPAHAFVEEYLRSIPGT